MAPKGGMRKRFGLHELASKRNVASTPARSSSCDRAEHASAVPREGHLSCERGRVWERSLATTRVVQVGFEHRHVDFSASPGLHTRGGCARRCGTEQVGLRGNVWCPSTEQATGTLRCFFRLITATAWFFLASTEMRDRSRTRTASLFSSFDYNRNSRNCGWE